MALLDLQGLELPEGDEMAPMSGASSNCSNSSWIACN
ncbi:SapB/AmfS family lanthipeptide [Streptomyces olivoreticuli]|nr:SapB/AmfS family lanthipeptide [Streptomyces olivoreticuli]WKK26617.1 SapB/AmfS family lanthipeptide [Streptomyces olivoreticuli]